MKTTTSPQPSEHQLQSALFEWAAAQRNVYPELRLMFAIPNGSFRHLLTGYKLKKEGVRPGVPDIFVPIPRAGRHGLFIEMKSATGVLSEEQKEWIHDLDAQGYRVLVIRSIDNAIDLLTEYLNSGP